MPSGFSSASSADNIGHVADRWTSQLDTPVARAWFAYHCLPREEAPANRRGKPPSYKKLEAELDGELPVALLSKLFTGQRRGFGADTAVAIAKALRVPLEWLMEGRGEPPELTGRIGPMPDKFADHDTAWLLEQATTATGDVDASRLMADNNFTIAVKYHNLAVNSPQVLRVKKQHRDRYPNGLQPEEWGALLIGDERKRVERVKKRRARRRRSDSVPASRPTPSVKPVRRPKAS